MYSFTVTNSLNDALVDKVGFGAIYLREDVVHLLGCPESIIMHSLAFATRTFTCATSSRFLSCHFDFSVKFHNVKNFVVSKNMTIFASKTRRWEGFPSLWFSNPNFKFDFDFPNPNENCGFHKAFGFSFFLLFSRFSDSSFCLSLTIQRYENYLKYANKIKNIFACFAFFLRKKSRMPIIRKVQIVKRE